MKDICPMEADLNKVMMSNSNVPVALYIKNQPAEKWQILTEAAYECLKMGYNLNLMELCRMARILQSKKSQNNLGQQNLYNERKSSRFQTILRKLFGK